ncbi:MAG: NHLP leader peptide family RiPP precursor [Gemmatimonadetes bacterium]|nr:NHLP leader peptide family RiPP precursor [Gemmatimonadota bacterium]MCZ0934080.1 NHLP leader peptide family RiPP precursor [Candidatus Palauibacter rhopaloidicola]
MNTMVQAAIQTSNEMQRHLVAKATDDAEFRAQLVANPNAAIKQEFGIDLPEYVSIQVHESRGNDLHLALPPSADAELELDEEALEAVAAGLCCCG